MKSANATPAAEITPRATDRKGGAKYLNLSLSSFDAMIARNEIHVSKIGRRVLVPLAELERILHGNGTPTK